MTEPVVDRTLRAERSRYAGMQGLVTFVEKAGLAISAPGNPERGFQDLLDLCAAALSPCRVSLLAVDEETQVFQTVVSVGFGAAGGTGAALDDLVGPARRALDSGEMVYVPEPDHGGDRSSREGLSIAAAPVKADGGPAGALVLERRMGERGARPFSRGNGPLIRAAASAAGVALSFRGLRDAYDRRLFNLAIVQQTGRLLVSTRDAEELLENLVTYVGDLLAARSCVLYTTEPEGRTLRVRATFGDPPSGKPETPFGKGAAGRSAESRLPLIVRDAPTHEVFEARFEAFPKAKNLLATPIIAQGEVRGVILVADHRSGRPFRESDLEMLNLFAGQAAVALDNLSLYDRLERAATTDHLTGLANRRSFQATLANEVDRAERYGHPLSLLTLDIDHFKLINDTYGHGVGDEVLRKTGGIIQAQVRRIDFAARCGGEEFAVIMPHTEKGFASGVAERLRHAFETSRMVESDGERTVTVSIGVAGFPADASDMDTLVDASDNALYRAKGAGRNRVIVA